MMSKMLLILASWVALATSGIATTDEEAESVERAARRYRIEIYQRFRLDRPQYNLRREQGDLLLEAWEQDEAEEHRQACLDWFAQAREASRAGADVALPVLPDFATAPAADAATDATVQNEPPEPPAAPELQSEEAEGEADAPPAPIDLESLFSDPAPADSEQTPDATEETPDAAAKATGDVLPSVWQSVGRAFLRATVPGQASQRSPVN